MLGNANLNVTQYINSFINPLGLSLSSKKQILAKVTTVALSAILLANTLPLASACSLTACLNACPVSGPEYSKCAQTCISNCYDA